MARFLFHYKECVYTNNNIHDYKNDQERNSHIEAIVEEHICKID